MPRNASRIKIRICRFRYIAVRTAMLCYRETTRMYVTSYAGN